MPARAYFRWVVVCPTQHPFGASGGYQVEAETAPSSCFRLESRVSRRKGPVSIN